MKDWTPVDVTTPARDRVHARLTGRQDPRDVKDKQNELEARVAEIHDAVPERTQRLMAKGHSYDSARAQALAEARAAEQRLRGTTPPSNEYLDR